MADAGDVIDGDESDESDDDAPIRPGASPADRVTTDPLLAAAVTTYHAGAFVLVPLLAAHLGGVLGDLLGGVGTVTGLVLFALLWAVLRWATGRWLAAFDPGRPLTAVRAGATYGALAGWLFLPVPVALAGLATGEPVLVAALLIAGSVVAPVVGAISGVLLGVSDALAVRSAGRLSPA